MKTIRILFQALTMAILAPAAAFASSTGTSSFGGEHFVLIDVIQSVLEFASGQLGVLVIAGGIVAGGFLIITNRENDSSGYKRIGKALIGGSIIFSAISLAGFFFSGATI